MWSPALRADIPGLNLYARSEGGGWREVLFFVVVYVENHFSSLNRCSFSITKQKRPKWEEHRVPPRAPGPPYRGHAGLVGRWEPLSPIVGPGLPFVI